MKASNQQYVSVHLGEIHTNMYTYTQFLSTVLCFHRDEWYLRMTSLLRYIPLASPRITQSATHLITVECGHSVLESLFCRIVTRICSPAVWPSSSGCRLRHNNRVFVEHPISAFTYWRCGVLHNSWRWTIVGRWWNMCRFLSNCLMSTLLINVWLILSGLNEWRRRTRTVQTRAFWW